MTALSRWQLTPLEVVSGFPIGEAPGLPLLSRPLDRAPVTALERSVMSALQRNPCVVSFSGGRDSSAILAVAARTARHEGLAPPIPVTLRFRNAPESDEADWQERVVRHLDLKEWVRLDLDDELDLVGPVAATILLRHGLLWPPNTHFHQPIVEVARGGAVLTGIDGDGLLHSWRWLRTLSVVTGRLAPEPRDVIRLLLALSPPAMRRTAQRMRREPPLPWLRPATMACLRKAVLADAAAEPVRWDARVRWYARRRSLRMVLHGFDRLANDHDVLAVHPFADPAFLAALARCGGWSGLGDRTAIMRLLFAEVLPDDVLCRRTKARLDVPFWNRYTQEFLRTWSGDGVDADLVDPGKLLTEWSRPVPHAYTSTLLQSAWLSQELGKRSGATEGGRARPETTRSSDIRP